MKVPPLIPFPRRIRGWLVLGFLIGVPAPARAESWSTDPDVTWVVRLGKAGPDSDQNSAELLHLAWDSDQPTWVRSQALQAYAAMAVRRHDAAALSAIRALRGAIGGGIDPALEALTLLGAPALPDLVALLGGCAQRPPAKGRCDDPKAIIEIEEADLAASAILVILERDPKATSPGLAASLIAAFDCGNRATRQSAAEALGLLDHLGEPDAVALRGRVAGDRRDDVRALAASVLAAHGFADPHTLQVLKRALAHRAELVQLSAANALVQLKHPALARATLTRLTRSRDPEIARLAGSTRGSLPRADGTPSGVDTRRVRP